MSQDPLRTNQSGLLDELYRDIIMDHYRSPRNHDPLNAPTCTADGANPLCGDTIHLEVEMDGDRIAQIAFSGSGCSISQASASMMTEYVEGRTAAEARRGADAFQRMMTTGETQSVEGFDDIDALQGVAKFAARVKCASLSWKTLEQALEGGGVATTEAGDETGADGGESSHD